MKTRIKIMGVEEKLSLKGLKYHQFETSHGKINIFADPIKNKLIEAMDKEVTVNMDQTEKDGRTYNNIRDLQFFEIHTDFEIEGNAITETQKVTNGRTYDKDPVGLAVEVFTTIMSSYLSGREDNVSVDYPVVMQDSIKLVKQAQEGFK